VNTNLSMDGGVASPLPGVVGKVYGFIVLDQPSALSSFSFLYYKNYRQVYSISENIGTHHYTTE